jgi:hypothetical protein
MTSRVIVSIRVPCSPVQAFEVFTEEIGEWWSHNDLLKLTPRSPGKLSFEPPSNATPGRLVEQLPNGKTFEIGPIRVWSPGEKLVVGWRQATFGPDHATEVEIRFEPVGNDTRVTVEHRGWETVPQEHVARHTLPLPIFYQWQGNQWRAGLDQLRNIISKID